MNFIDTYLYFSSFKTKSKLTRVCLKPALLIFLTLSTFLLSCGQNESNKLVIYQSFSEFEQELTKADDKIHVVNFWATWCKPCVKELPYFEQLHENYKDKSVEVNLVSIDRKNQIETHLKPFIKKHNLQSRQLLLLDRESNEWMPKVDEIWSGGIPVTVIYNKDDRIFLDFAFSDYQELELYLNQFTK